VSAAAPTFGPVPRSAGEPAAATAPALADLLACSLEELVAAGRVHAACVLAGRACAATRHSDVRTWKRFNTLLHRWSARAPDPVDIDPAPLHDERSPPAR